MAADTQPREDPDEERTDLEELGDPYPDLSNLEETVAWRVDQLFALGFSLEQILQIMLRPDVVHDAQDLLDLGAPHAFIVAELAP